MILRNFLSAAKHVKQKVNGESSTSGERAPASRHGGSVRV